jgi:hypothetical protein
VQLQPQVQIQPQVQVQPLVQIQSAGKEGIEKAGFGHVRSGQSNGCKDGLLKDAVVKMA